MGLFLELHTDFEKDQGFDLNSFPCYNRFMLACVCVTQVPAPENAQGAVNV